MGGKNHQPTTSHTAVTYRGSDHAMSRYFQNFSPESRCFFPLEARFRHQKWAYKELFAHYFASKKPLQIKIFGRIPRPDFGPCHMEEPARFPPSRNNRFQSNFTRDGADFLHSPMAGVYFFGNEQKAEAL